MPSSNSRCLGHALVKWILLYLLGISLWGCTPPTEQLPPTPTATAVSSNNQPTPSPAETASSPTELATVEADVFSGRPNPTWPLSAADTQSFLQQVAALPSLPAQVLEDPLGYRGLRVHIMDMAGQITSYRVWHEVVEVRTIDDVRYYSDVDHTLEKWLLQTGQASLAPEIFELITTEISR